MKLQKENSQKELANFYPLSQQLFVFYNIMRDLNKTAVDMTSFKLILMGTVLNVFKSKNNV